MIVELALVFRGETFSSTVHPRHRLKGIEHRVCDAFVRAIDDGSDLEAVCTDELGFEAVDEDLCETKAEREIERSEGIWEGKGSRRNISERERRTNGEMLDKGSDSFPLLYCELRSLDSLDLSGLDTTRNVGQVFQHRFWS
jgi:hypothetical protein